MIRMGKNTLISFFFFFFFFLCVCLLEICSGFIPSSYLPSTHRLLSTKLHVLVAKRSAAYVHNFTWPPNDWSIFKTHFIPFHVDSQTKTKKQTISMESVFIEDSPFNRFRNKYESKQDIGCMIDDDEDGNEEHDRYGIKDYELYEWMIEEINKLPDIPETGDIVNGTIVAWTNNRNGVLIEYGGKELGIMPIKETSFSGSPIPIPKNPDMAIGNVVTAMLVGTLDGRPVLSIRRLQIPSVWQSLMKAKADNTVVNITLTSFNKGGAMGMCEGLQCFVPRTHLKLALNNSLVGKIIQAKILQISPNERKLIVSQSTVSTVTAPEVGTLVDALVSNIVSYGVYLNIAGGSKGLLHRKQITSSPQRFNVSDHFHIGQKIRVFVDSRNAVGNLALTLKPCERYPGEALRNMTVMLARAEETLSAKRLFVGGKLPLFEKSNHRSQSLLDIANSLAGANMTVQDAVDILDFGESFSGQNQSVDFNNGNGTLAVGKSRRASKIDSMLESLENAASTNEKAQQFNYWIMKNMTSDLQPLIQEVRKEIDKKSHLKELKIKREKQQLLAEAKRAFAAMASTSASKSVSRASKTGASRKSNRSPLSEVLGQESEYLLPSEVESSMLRYLGLGTRDGSTVTPEEASSPLPLSSEEIDEFV